MVLLWIPERILQLLLLPVSRLQYEPLLTAETLAQHPEQRSSRGVLAATKTVLSSGHQLILPAQSVQMGCPQGRTAVFNRKVGR